MSGRIQRRTESSPDLTPRSVGPAGQGSRAFVGARSTQSTCSIRTVRHEQVRVIRGGCERYPLRDVRLRSAGIFALVVLHACVRADLSHRSNAEDTLESDVCVIATRECLFVRRQLVARRQSRLDEVVSLALQQCIVATNERPIS